MERRKSERSKKSIDYAKFSCGDSEDDDFMTSPSPPNKKRKQDKAANLNSEVSAKREGKLSLKSLSSVKRLPDVNNSQDDKTTSDPSSKPNVATKVERLPVVEKIFQRELQAAIELSMKGSPTTKSTDTEKNSDEKEDVTNEDCNTNVSSNANSSDEDSEDYPESEDSSEEWSEETVPPKNALKEKGLKKHDAKSAIDKPSVPSKQSGATVKKYSNEVEKLPANITKSSYVRTSKMQKASINQMTNVHELIKPANLPTLGLRLGLSRRAAIKPLHPTLKINP